MERAKRVLEHHVARCRMRILGTLVHSSPICASHVFCGVGTSLVFMCFLCDERATKKRELSLHPSLRPASTCFAVFNDATKPVSPRTAYDRLLFYSELMKGIRETMRKEGMSPRARYQLRARRCVLTWGGEIPLKSPSAATPSYIIILHCRNAARSFSHVPFYFLQAGAKPLLHQMLRQLKKAMGNISKDEFSAVRDVPHSDDKGVGAQAIMLRFFTGKDFLTLETKLMHQITADYHLGSLISLGSSKIDAFVFKITKIVV